MPTLDAFLENVSHLTGRPIPDELRKERGRLINAMIDVQFKIAQKKVAIHERPRRRIRHGTVSA